MSQDKPYDYVRFTWWHTHNPRELAEILKDTFTVTFYARPGSLEEDRRYDLSPYKGQRWEILVKADTLSAFLSAWRAVLFQRERAPFTKRDMKLREMILKLYPRITPTPFPWGFSHEPPFEVEEETEKEDL